VNLLEKQLSTVYFKYVRFPWVTLYVLLTRGIIFNTKCEFNSKQNTWYSMAFYDSYKLGTCIICSSCAFNQLNSQHVFLKSTLEQYHKSQLVPFLSFL